MELAALADKHKNNILNAAIILLALAISGNIYQRGAGVMDAIQREKEMAMKKNSVVAEIAKLETRIASYKDFVGKKESNAAMRALSEIAKESGVKINLIKPAGAQKDQHYEKLSFELSVSAANYHALGKLISRIESHKDIFIIELANIDSAGYGQALGTAVGISGKKELTANIKLSTVEMVG